MLKSTAIIYEKYGKPLYLDEISIEDPEPDQVIVKMIASGVCGSQLINLNNKNSKNPEILGHEGTGVAVKIGKSVKHVKEGDNVLISWMPYNANEKTEYLEWTNKLSWKGNKIKTLLFTWSEYTIMHKQFVSKIDSNLNQYSCSIIGCAGIAGYGTVNNSVKIKKNDSVVIIGVGGLGCLAINAAKNLNANPLIAVDIRDEKLKFAKKFGATHTINANKNDFLVEIYNIEKEGVDFVFDMAGKAEIREKTILASKAGIPGFCEGGTVILTGFPEGVAEFNPRSILMGERTYKGSRGGGCVPKLHFPKFYQDIRDGILNLEQAVTNKIKMEDINEGIEKLRQGNILGRMIIEIS